MTVIVSEETQSVFGRDSAPTIEPGVKQYIVPDTGKWDYFLQIESMRVFGSGKKCYQLKSGDFYFWKKVLQGGHGTGNLVLTFARQGNRKFCCNMENF